MSKDLWTDFDEISAKQWKQKIQFDLKGADYNDTLIWNSLEGIDVKPFYHQDDLNLEFVEIPGHPKAWIIAQEIFIDKPEIANRLILGALEKGAEALILTAEKEFNYKAVFDNISPDCKEIHFRFRFLSNSFISELIRYFKSLDIEIFFNIDIIGNLAKNGNWFFNNQEDHSILEKMLVDHADENLLSVDLSLYQNAGANMVQQLAYSLAQVNEYLNHFKAEINNKKIELGKIIFQVSVGSNYFFEIAKIRALRKLYALIANEYGVSPECFVISSPSKRNKSIYDYNVNMLRTTTESMSAILGGANTICNLAYDSIYHKSNEFGERIARNQLLILKSESHFNIVDNPADGSYYIESLTASLAEKTLVLFKDIEANGGLVKQLFNGTIQRKIKESAEKEIELFQTGYLKLLGSNYHPNPDDRMHDQLEIYPFIKTKNHKTIIEPIIEKRIPENLEKERIANETK